MPEKGQTAKREFCVDTPLGRLKVWAKHDGTDCAEDYPGVYIDLVKDGEPDVLLACIEYDSCDKELQASVYGITSNDSPTNIIVFGVEYRDKTDV